MGIDLTIQPFIGLRIKVPGWAEMQINSILSVERAGDRGMGNEHEIFCEVDEIHHDS